MTLLGIAVLSAALFALPAVAAAQEMEVDPGAGTQFTVSGGATSLTAAGEPTITCETIGGEGEQLSKTKGTVLLDLKGCHYINLGLTIPCRSTNAVLKNTIAFSEIFHFIIYNNKPAALFTSFPTITCEDGTKIEIGGKGLIGTITAPACNVESKTMTIKFAVAGGKQEHMLYTGANYDLTYTTEGVSTVTAAFSGEPKFTFPVNVKMTC